MSVICHIDNTEHENLDALHDYIKSHMKRETYYLTYLRRKDLLTGEDIPFKTAEQYLSTDFVNKENMRKWVLKNKEEGLKWAINWLKERKVSKNLRFAPTQAELRSLCCPSMSYFDRMGGYYNITSDLGFEARFYDEQPVFTRDLEKATLIQDTREQTPLKFSLNTEIKKLDVGDYGLAEPFNQNIYIERKSLNDFVGSLSSRKIERKKKSEDSSYERIDRELARAVESNSYIIMIVESSIDDALSFNELPWMRHGKASPSHIFKNMRDLLVKYPLNFQIVFANGRADASRKLLRIFQMGEQVKRIDLEYATEKGAL